MENFKALNEQLTARNSEIERLDREIREVQGQIDDMKSRYPKLLVPAPAEAKRFIEMGEHSDWRNDDVEIRQDGEALHLKNVSKLERLQSEIDKQKMEAGELAFKMVTMTEANSTTYARNEIQHDILERKQKVEAAGQEMKALDSSEVHFNSTGYRTDPQANKNAAMLHAIHLIKPVELYGKRISYKDLVDKLEQEFKVDMDEKSKDMVRAAYNDLLARQDDLYRQKSAA